MITIFTNVSVSQKLRKQIDSLIGDATYFKVANKTITHESEFSDIVCEGYLIDIEVDDVQIRYIADIEDGSEYLCKLKGADGLSKDDLRKKLEDQLLHEHEVYQKGVKNGEAKKAAQIRDVLGVAN
ncbi:hypothetical protein OCT63_19720 [Vibrio sp. RW]|uniref:hypothetical protein n=1 Tax=Vibrio sp. RW TaxID=2998833 RepID=UPI0022CDBAC1|nr:hypothetical protein [Vibrio sp. RW]MDA0146459.1 hypothetical protein [Vibrio sp. RW]